MMGLWPGPRFWVTGAGLIAVATLGATTPLFGWGPPLWDDLTEVTREGIVLPAIVVSVLGARTGRAFHPRSVVMGRTASRSSAVVAAHLSGLAVTATVGYTTGLVPGMIVLARGADAGTLDLLALAGVYAALVAVTFGSYALAAVMPTRWAGITAPLACTGLIYLPALLNPALGPLGRSTLQSAVIWLNDYPLLGWRVTPQTSLFRVFLFTAVAAGSALVVRRVAVPTSGSTLLAAAGAWGVVALMTAASILISPPLVRWEPAPATCTSSDPSICVHPANASLAPDISDAVRRGLSAVGSAGHLERLQQVGTTSSGSSATVTWFRLDNPQSATDVDRAVLEAVAFDVSGGPACLDALEPYGYTTDLPADLQSALELQSALAWAIQERAGLAVDTGSHDEATGAMVRSPAQQALHSLDDEEFRWWFADHLPAVRICSLGEDDLP